MKFLPNSDFKTVPFKYRGVVALCSIAIALSACASKEKRATKKAVHTPGIAKDIPHINNKTKFSSKTFGVKGSPRVTTKKSVRKGGGRYQVGKPYTIRGKRYYPKEDKNLKQVGMASWYGPNFHGRLTANGEVYDQYSLSAAHPTMPLPSYAKVTNLVNGRTVTVRVNDRGPYAHGRVIDLSAQAAKMLDYTHKGVTKVKVEYVGKARMDGLDEKMLMASYIGPNSGATKPVVAQETLIAMADTVPTPTQPTVQIRSAMAPSLNVDTSASASAIGENFKPSNPIPLSIVPIPTNRPEIFEQVQQGSVVGYQVIRKPLAYLEQEETLFYSDFRKENYNKNNAIKLFSKKSVEIELGSMAREVDKHALVNLFTGSGEIRFEGSRAVINIAEQQANTVVDYALAIGLTAVAIR